MWILPEDGHVKAGRLVEARLKFAVDGRVWVPSAVRLRQRVIAPTMEIIIVSIPGSEMRVIVRRAASTAIVQVLCDDPSTTETHQDGTVTFQLGSTLVQFAPELTTVHCSQIPYFVLLQEAIVADDVGAAVRDGDGCVAVSYSLLTPTTFLGRQLTLTYPLCKIKICAVHQY